MRALTYNEITMVGGGEQEIYDSGEGGGGGADFGSDSYTAAQASSDMNDLAANLAIAAGVIVVIGVVAAALPEIAIATAVVTVAELTVGLVTALSGAAWLLANKLAGM